MWVPVTQPFDLDLTLKSGQVFRWRFDQGWWSGFIGTELFFLRQMDGGLEVITDSLNNTDITLYLEWFFRFDDDLATVYNDLSSDILVADACKAYEGMRLLRQDPWECLIGFISSTASNIPRIARVQERLASELGRPVLMNGMRRNAFPDPTTLSMVGEPVLRELGLGYRARYVGLVSTKIASGEFILSELEQLDYVSGRKKLLTLPGVGVKVADCVQLFAFGKLESFPIDRWVRRALEQWYFGGRKTSDQVLSDWAQGVFSPWAGYAQQYLFFRSRDVKLIDDNPAYT